MRSRPIAPALEGPQVLLMIGLLGAIWGLAVAAGGLTSFYLCVSLIACGVILVDFRIGVVLLIVLMPLSGSSTIFPHEMFGIVGLNPLNVLLAGCVLSCMLHMLPDGSLQRLLPRPLLWLYVVPILIAGAIGTRHFHEIAPALHTAYHGLDFPNAMSYLVEMVFKPLLMVVFAVLVGAAVARSERPERLLAPILVAVCLMAALTLAFVAHSGFSLHQLASSEARELLSPLGLHANDLGRLYAAAFTLALFTLPEVRSGALRMALLLAMGLSVAALILTFSRGGFVAFGVACLLYMLRRFSVKTMVLGGVLVAAALVFAPHAIYERLTTGEGEGINGVSAGRLNGLWLPLLPEVVRHPLLGNGIGSIMWSEPMHRLAPGLMLVVTHPHNAFLQAALDMGITGLVLLCAYFVHAWKGLRELTRDPQLPATLQGFFQGAAVGVVGMLVSDFTDSSLVPRPEHAFIWLAIGMMYGYRARRIAAAPAPNSGAPARGARA